MGRFEQDYRETLDGLAFSGAGKERIMKNLMKQQEGRTVKGKRFRVVRAVILAALDGAHLSNLFQLFAELINAAADMAAIAFEFGFAGAAGTDTAA